MLNHVQHFFYFVITIEIVIFVTPLARLMHKLFPSLDCARRRLSSLSSGCELAAAIWLDFTNLHSACLTETSSNLS